MNLLLLGEGGSRDHALAWKIKQSPLVEKFYATSRNPGLETLCEDAPFNAHEHDALVAFCRKLEVGLVVVSPDVFLAEGAVDVLRAAGIPAFGPTKAAAEIEWSKAYAKQLMQEEGIPTAASRIFTDFESARAYVASHTLPVVIKVSGLARGKGVTVAETSEEAIVAIREAMLENTFGDSGKEIVIEEFMEGIEISVHALCAGEEVILFPSAQDHKRLGENDIGPNTGGMGTIAPVPGVSEETMIEIRDRIVLPMLRALKKRNRPFLGLLFPGVMLTKEGPKVIEFNARFGGPETESYMRLLTSDIVPALLACANGSLAGVELEWSKDTAVCIVLASAGYPGVYEKGKEIKGVIEAEAKNTLVFHAGTAYDKDGKLVTDGGRVLAVTAVGKDLMGALDAAYAGVREISFEGMQYRGDIGRKAVH